jgi:hypothetical protein
VGALVSRTIGRWFSTWGATTFWEQAGSASPIRNAMAADA